MTKPGRPRTRWVVGGFDIGHGETKWASDWGRGHHKSVVARETPGIRFDLGMKGNVQVKPFIIENGVTRGGLPSRFAVGEYSYNVGVPVQALDIGRLDDEEYRVLVNSALSMAIKSSGPVLYVTGLPVDHLAKKDKLRDILAGTEGKRWEVKLITPLEDGEDGEYYYDLYPDTVFILPEGLGGLMSLYLTDSGRINSQWAYLETKKVGVVDIGTYSTDISTFEPGLTFNENKTQTLRVGLGTVYDTIIRTVKYDERGMDIDRRTAEQIMKTGKLHIGKKVEDVSGWVKAALEDIGSQIIAELRRLWQSGMEIEIILLLGGGADHLIDQITSAFEQTTEVIPVPDAPSANAIGYYRYGQYRLAKMQAQGLAEQVAE